MSETTDEELRWYLREYGTDDSEVDAVQFAQAALDARQALSDREARIKDLEELRDAVQRILNGPWGGIFAAHLQTAIKVTRSLAESSKAPTNEH